MGKSICFVLKPGVDREHVRTAAENAGLKLATTLQGDGRRLSYEEIWATSDRMTAVNYVEDPIVNVAYLAFRGRDREALATNLTAALPVFTHDEAVALARSVDSHNDRVRAVYRLAVMFPDYDPQAYELMRDYATEGRDDLLREAAVDAMAYRSWPQFLGLLEHIERHDPADSVRRRAAAILPYVRAAVASRGAPGGVAEDQAERPR